MNQALKLIHLTAILTFTLVGSFIYQTTEKASTNTQEMSPTSSHCKTPKMTSEDIQTRREPLEKATRQGADGLRGIDLENVIFLEITFSSGMYSEPQQRLGFVQQVLRRIRTLPQVESAGVINSLPFSNSYESRTLSAEVVTTTSPAIRYNAITPDFFHAVRLPLLKGRSFIEQDHADTPGVIILSDSVARKLFPDSDPIGKRVSLSPSTQGLLWKEVVGVVGDVQDLSGQRRADIYLAYSQEPVSNINIVVRCKRPSKRLDVKLKEEIQGVDNQVRVSTVLD